MEFKSEKASRCLIPAAARTQSLHESAYTHPPTPRVEVVGCGFLIDKGVGPTTPRESKYPTFELSGSKNHALMVFGTRVPKCCVLGPLGTKGLQVAEGLQRCRGISIMVL